MSLPRYAEYKDSGVQWLDKVPAHWGVSPCRAVVEEKSEKNEGAVDQRYLSLMANIGIIPYEEKGDVGNKKPEDLSKCKLVAKGDLVINSMNYGIGSYGLSALDGVCSPVYIVLRPRLDRIESRFALRAFENRAFQTYAQSFGNGILEHRAAINWDILKVIGVGVPPMAEQLEILTFLDRETGKIDALIAEQEKLLTLLAEKRQAIISHAVTRGLNPNAPMKDSGVPWLDEVPSHWKLPPLYLRYTVELGKMLDTNKITGEHLTPYLRNVDVQWDRINTEDLPCMDISPDETSRFTVRDGDLLVCEGGEVGRAAVVAGLTATIGYQKALHRLRSLGEDESPRYLFFVFRWTASTGAFSGEGQSTIAHLTGEQLRKYRFPKPPLEEQQSIAAFLDAKLRGLDSLQAEAEQMVSLLKERRSALIAAAVTGKIDVRQAA